MKLSWWLRLLWWKLLYKLQLKLLVKTGYHTILYNGPPQRQSGRPRSSILFGRSTLFTMVPSSPINTVVEFPWYLMIRNLLHVLKLPKLCIHIYEISRGVVNLEFIWTSIIGMQQRQNGSQYLSRTFAYISSGIQLGMILYFALGYTYIFNTKIGR